MCIAGSADFQLTANEVVLPPTTAQDQVVCVAAVAIFGDDIVEGNETFQVIIQPTNPLDMVSMGRNTTTITIVDDDGKHQPYTTTVPQTWINAMNCLFATHRSNCLPQWDQHCCSRGRWRQHNCWHLYFCSKWYRKSTTRHCALPNSSTWQCQQ